MNKRGLLWGVMMLCFAVVLLLSGSQSVLAVSASGEQPMKVRRADPSAVLASLGALAISGGSGHTCAVTSLGGAQCWGFNRGGELGNNSTTDSDIPVNVSGLASGVTAISAGAYHSCAVVSGAVKCWGDNSAGELGDGTTVGSPIPVSVTGLSGITAVAAGYGSTCALTSGGLVKCWGDNSKGELGDGTTTQSHVPVSVSGLSGVTAIAVGTRFACALTGGTVKCWGDNYYGQLGDGTTTESHTPVQVSGLSGVTAIQTGNTHACALTDAGSVECWGQNYYGQLGNNSTTDSHSPVTVSGLSGVTAIAAGRYHSCAVAGSGAKCWGGNAKGQLGNNTLTDSSIPVDVSGLGSGVVQIAAGASHNCVVMNTGGVRCWGDNTYGQLGNSENSYQTAPVDVNGLSSNIIGIGISWSHACALTSGGGVKCWGTNNYGQLGNNSTTDSLTPVDVTGLTSGVQAIAVGGYHACALTGGGGVKCWGKNASGELGNNTTTNSLTPVDVSGLASGVTAIAAGEFHSCALLSGGSVKCWGMNVYGQLGNNSTIDSSVPVDVSGLAGVTAISAGGGHTCAVAGGGAKCWGHNSFGQLGNSSTTDSHIPVDVNGLASGVTSIGAGGYHTCAVASGGAKCWGNGGYGQLGNGSTSSKSIPVNVSGLASGVDRVAAGSDHSCALTTGGGMKCWGDNWSGELGNNSVTSSSIPVDVSGLASGVSVIASGARSSCAVVGPLSGGTAKCWGDDYYGQVGNGHMGFRPTPVDVSGLTGQIMLYLPIVLR